MFTQRTVPTLQSIAEGTRSWIDRAACSYAVEAQERVSRAMPYARELANVICDLAEPDCKSSDRDSPKTDQDAVYDE